MGVARARRTRRKASAAKAAGKKASHRKASASRARLTPRREKQGLAPEQILLALESPELRPLVARVRELGGAPLGGYREPLRGRPLLLASLPVEAVEPTPFQRDLSPTHTKRLAAKIEESGSFLDPLIVVQGREGQLWTPNGRHRLAAARLLGLRQITVLISVDEDLAFRILALNTEKAHNLRDRSLARSLREREGWAARLLTIDQRVGGIIEGLRERGFRSPYLRTPMVARINPVRFHRAKKGQKDPPMSLAAGLTRMAAAARRFDIGSVRERDLALLAAVGAAEDEA